MLTKRLLMIVMVLIVLLLITTPLTARANESLAIGGQLGFLATGAVIDIPLGPIAIQAGVNYPLGIAYIDAIADLGGALTGLFDSIFVATADVTFPISLGENFDLKIGVSTLAFTDFNTSAFGMLGPAIKGEYWIPNKNYGLYVHLNSPLMVYGVTEADGFMYEADPAIALLGLFTTTAGVLWAL